MFSNSNADSEYRQPLLDTAENHLDDQYDAEPESSALATPRTAGGSKVVTFKDEVQVRVFLPPLRSTTTSREAGELKRFLLSY
jgi:hypothetical protein